MTLPPCTGAFLARLALVLGAAVLCASPVRADSVRGAWQAWNALPFFPVHSHVLPNGKVMIWPGDAGINGDQGRLLDIGTQNLSAVPQAGFDLFCSGHAFMADGRLLVAGGHIANNIGEARATIYDPSTNSWTHAPSMNLGRWYPTVTTLADGKLLVVAGDVDTTTGTNPLPQVYEPSTNSWRSLTNAQLAMPLYPNMFVAPDGRVVNVGPEELTRALDTSGSGQWTSLNTSRAAAYRDYGSAVMYADGKILFMGGGTPPTAAAEVLDLNVPTPRWRTVAPMSVARRQLNATVLPDGKVLVTGGTYGEGFNNATTPVYTAELWDPATETWTTMASAGVARLYHSAATLLPDGRVLSTGGNGKLTPEVFSPPYLFKGPRPVISAAPPSIGWGERFVVQTPQAAGIAKVTLVRLTSVTHSFNMNQRLNVLPFTAVSGGVESTAPASGNIAPPGDYLLFLVDAQGVPSVGSMIRLGAAAPPTAPTPVLTALAPSSAVAGSPGFSLDVSGSSFAAGATVRWNGANRSTTVVDTTRLTAQIPSTDVATAGTYGVTVVNPGSAVSNSLPFTVTAPAPTRYSLSVSKSGPENGKSTVTSTPAGIACGKSCVANFSPGTSVTLSATPASRTVFLGWSGGGCSGTGTCTVVMNANTSVNAQFGRR